MNNYQISKEAAGLFSKNAQQPHFGDAASNPIRKMMLGNANKCETIAFNHGQVEAHMVVTGAKELRVVQIPFKTFNVESDPDMEDPLVAGTIGASCANN